MGTSDNKHVTESAAHATTVCLQKGVVYSMHSTVPVSKQLE